MEVTSLTINGMNVVVDGEAQVFFDAESNTLRILTKERVVEKVKVIKSKPNTVWVEKPVYVPVQPVPHVPWRPWDDWQKYTLCHTGTTIKKNT